MLVTVHWIQQSHIQQSQNQQLQIEQSLPLFCTQSEEQQLSRAPNTLHVGELDGCAGVSATNSKVKNNKLAVNPNPYNIPRSKQQPPNQTTTQTMPNCTRPFTPSNVCCPCCPKKVLSNVVPNTQQQQTHTTHQTRTCPSQLHPCTWHRSCGWVDPRRCRPESPAHRLAN